MCLFIAFPALDIPECLTSLIDMINARFAINLTGDDVTALGKSVLKIEHQFNLDAGLSKEHDRLPEFFSLERIARITRSGICAARNSTPSGTS